MYMYFKLVEIILGEKRTVNSWNIFESLKIFSYASKYAIFLSKQREAVWCSG